MALQTGNIVILKSDTMNDTDSGGGNITSQVVVGGESNNVFDDVSPLDRTTGALNLRKVFPAVSIGTTDKYFGAHTIISKIPADSQVNVALFNGKDWHDRRAAASDRIAGYFGKGADYSGFLFGTAWAGSSSIRIFQSEEIETPLVGDVLILTQGNDYQYIRVSEISAGVQSFTVSGKSFTRLIVEITTTDALQYDFVGAPITNEDNINPATVINKAIVANSAKYYSARPLDALAYAGDTSIKADTLFTQLVPNTLVEFAKVDQDPSTELASPVTIDGDDFTYSESVYIANTATVSLNGAVSPGTLSMTTSAGTITDDSGSLVLNGLLIGTINYNTGLLTFNSSVPSLGTTTVHFSFVPAAPVIRVQASRSTEITIANRGQVFTQSLFQEISPGSLTVSFRSYDVWYTLHDNANGGLFGDSASIGSGTINYATGSISISLGELPDVGSEIIYSWGTNTAISKVSTSAEPVTTSVEYSKTVSGGFSIIFTIEDLSIDLESLTLSWGSSTVNCDATGVLSGDGIGYLTPISNGYVVNLKWKTITMPKGTVITVNYDTVTPTTTVVDYVTDKNVDDTITITIPNAPLKPGSVNVYWEVNNRDYQDAETNLYFSGRLYGTTLLDNGTGALTDSTQSRNEISGSSINYTTGVVTFKPERLIGVNSVTITNGNFVNTPTTMIVLPDESLRDITVKASTLTSVATGTITHTVNVVQFVANGDGRGMNIVPGSVRFTSGSNNFYSSEYDVLRNGVVVGSINKTTSVVTLTDWSGVTNYNPDVTNVTMLNSESIIPDTDNQPEAGFTAVSEFVFRITGGAIKSESFQMLLPYNIPGGSSTRYYPLTAFGATVGLVPRPITSSWDEQVLIVSADANGDLSGLNQNGTGDGVINGTINYETGIVKFTLRNQYNDEVFFDPSRIVYSVTNKKFTPIDTSILGIDHVRLPENGRVPAYAVGDVVVIHNTREVSVSPAVNDVTNLGQLDLAKVTATDSGGATLQNTQYSVDLDQGLVTWTDLVGVILPIKVTYTIEDLSTLGDVQIDGTLGLNIPLTHDYPLADTMISNALIHGDMFANVSNPFDQSTFTGVWSDVIIGNPTLGEFNNSQYPIVVTNRDCIEERWLIQFSSSSLINVIGENVGQVLSGVSILNTSGTIAPINPSTGFPYFTIDNKAFGGGWSSGNCIRFNTHAANAPVWIIQSVNQGPAGSTDDDALGFCLEFRGARNTIA